MTTEEFNKFVKQEVINTNALVAALGLPKD